MPILTKPTGRREFKMSSLIASTYPLVAMACVGMGKMPGINRPLLYQYAMVSKPSIKRRSNCMSDVVRSGLNKDPVSFVPLQLKMGS